MPKKERIMLELQLVRVRVFEDFGSPVGWTWGIREWNSALLHPLKFKRIPKLRSKYKIVPLKWLKRKNPQKLNVVLTPRGLNLTNFKKYSLEDSKEMRKLIKEFPLCEKKSENLEAIESFGISYELYLF